MEIVKIVKKENVVYVKLEGEMCNVLLKKMRRSQFINKNIEIVL